MNRRKLALGFAAAVGLGLTTAATAYVHRSPHTAYLGTVLVLGPAAHRVAVQQPVYLGSIEVKAKALGGKRYASGRPRSSTPVALGTIYVTPQDQAQQLTADLGKNANRNTYSPVAVIKYLAELVFARAGG